MHRVLRFSLYTFVLVAFAAVAGFAQNSNQSDFPFPDRDGRRKDDSTFLRDALSKQQMEREKKEHEELMQRADAVLELTDEIDKAYEKNPSLTPAEEKKLAELEKLVKKIRDELGGSDDEDVTDEDKKPESQKAAFSALKSSAVKLVDEIRKTTRFSISAVAIQSSNAVIRIIKFIRFKH